MKTEIAAELKSQESTAPAQIDNETSALLPLDDDELNLLAGKIDDHWLVFSSDAVKRSDSTWKIVPESTDSDAESVLVCSGEPKGFLFTKEQYADFELTLEWKYPTDENGNSGVLIYTQDEPRIWPTSIQVQFHQPKAGSIFPSGDATSDNTRDALPELARPVNTWNACRIVSRRGRIGVEINGKKSGEISGASPSCGSVALQCEGSEVHFRRIRLKKLNLESLEPATDTDLIPANTEPPEPVPTTSRAEARRRKRESRHSRYFVKSIALEPEWQHSSVCPAGTTLDGQSGCERQPDFPTSGE